MAEEVKIVIREEAQGNAITAEQRKINDLHAAIARANAERSRLLQSATAYEGKGMGDAAKSARSDAANYEKDILRAKKEIAEIEKGITGEKAKQAIFSPRAKQELFTAGRNFAQGDFGQGVRSLSAAMGQILPQITTTIGRMAILAGGAAVAGIGIGAALIRARVGQADLDAAQQMAAAHAGETSTRGLLKLNSPLGGAGAAFSAEVESGDRLQQLRQQREDLEREAKSGILGRFFPSFFTKGAGWYKPESARAIERNANEQRRAEEDARQQERIRQRQFDEGEGGLGLQVERDRAQHSIAGNRALRIDMESLSGLREYNRLVKEGASNTQALEGAHMKVREELYKQGLNAAGGLVNARSGAGDIAAAASLAQSQGIGSNAEVIRKLDEHINIARTHLNSVLSGERKDFSEQ